MEKLNIAEILKDCPSGMELDCTMFGGLEFDSIVDNSPLPIRCRILNPDGNGYNICDFTKYGCWSTLESAKCVIFPKGKTTWEGFQRPFKDGDVVVCVDINEWGKEEASQIFILKSQTSENNGFCYTGYDFKRDKFFNAGNWSIERLATEEEKQKLFDAIKANGYKWNTETKILEKLIVPKFKVGDKVRYKGESTVITITDVKDNYYFIQFYNIKRCDYQNEKVSFKDQNDWELVPNKFDITTLKPFESRVLVRTNNRKWVAAFYSHYDKDSLLHHCVVGGLWYEQCVPYNGNEHLLDTTNDCDNYFKTWE